ncbi:MAG TPA: DEAD/DEAH box helicase, partial [Chitinophagales bacterium]|nr:DEAD/DEAH box helicase [Chitinophagales bacterium]
MATTFADLGLDQRLLSAVESMGFTEPTPIQAKAIPVLISGTTDMVALAQTGTGKTAAFGLPLLQLVDAAARHPQALIVCPTRELCVQLTKELEAFKKNIKEIRAVAVYGGAPINNQIKEIKRGVHIVVATPGRLIDLIERRAVDLEQIKYVVLDEADEMLNMGFREDIEFILGNTPKKESTWLFSATMPPEVRQVSKRFMNKPVEVSAGKLNTANVNIDHQYFV